MRRNLSYFLLLPLLLTVTSCLPLGSQRGSVKPKGNGDGVLGVIATYDNARVRCGFLNKENNRSRVLCQTVALGTDGNESVATDVASGVNLSWSEPSLVEGTRPRDISCRNDLLTQTCDVSFSEGDST